MDVIGFFLGCYFDNNKTREIQNGWGRIRYMHVYTHYLLLLPMGILSLSHTHTHKMCIYWKDLDPLRDERNWNGIGRNTNFF